MDDDVDKYLDAESSIYTNDMRFYVDDDWPWHFATLHTFCVPLTFCVCVY